MWLPFQRVHRAGAFEMCNRGSGVCLNVRACTIQSQVLGSSEHFGAEGNASGLSDSFGRPKRMGNHRPVASGEEQLRWWATACCSPRLRTRVNC